MTFMIVFYKLSGINAVVALLLNVLILFAPWPTSRPP